MTTDPKITVSLDTVDIALEMAGVVGVMFRSFIAAGIPSPVAEQMILMYWAEQLEESRK